MYSISVSIFIINSFYLYSNYYIIPSTIVTHIYITGKADGFGDKVDLIYAMIANANTLGLLCFFVLFPKYANYPIVINDTNRKKAYLNIQYFLSIVSIITTVAFSFLIFKAIDKLESMIFIILYALLSPLIAIYFFIQNK